MRRRFPSAPAVSVVVPTNNRPDMLVSALESIARQTFRDFEVVVVNDAGEDVSIVVEGFASRMPVRLVTHKKNRGVAAARNTGITVSSGKYIAYLDDDDYYFERHLAVLHTFLSRSGYRAAYTDARQDIQQPDNDTYRTVASNEPYSADFSRDLLYRINITPVLCVMHERACLARCGMFAEYLEAHEDWDLWLRMARHYDWAHIPEVTCAFTTREDRSSLSTGRKDAMRDTWVFTRLQGLYAEQTPPVHCLDAASRHMSRLGPEQPEPCAVSIVLPLAVVDARTPRNLAALCAAIGDAQLVLVGAGLDRTSIEPLHRSLADILPRPPLALCNAGEIGRVYAANQGAAFATGEWLIFLEEEVYPKPGWLEALLRAASGQPNLGALGGVLSAPGLPQLAGGTMDADGTPVYAPLAADAATPFQRVQLLSGHCLMLRRETFAALGGFDPAFAPAHYADADLCQRLARQGRLCGIATEARLTWNKNGLPLLQSSAGVLSRRIFKDRWASGVQTAKLDTRGAGWSLRTSLWPSDGRMPEKFEAEMPSNLLE